MTFTFPDHDLVPTDEITLHCYPGDTYYDGQTFTVDSTSGDDVVISVTQDLAPGSKRSGVYVEGLMGHGWHPAFYSSNVAGSNDITKVANEIMVGQFKSSKIGNRFYSLPRTIPNMSLTYSADFIDQSFLSKGFGWHPMNIWDWSAINLWILQNNLEHGCNFPYDYDHDTGYASGSGAPVNPDDDYYREVLHGQDSRWNTATSTYGQQGTYKRFYTGTGPADWRHDGTLTGISDMVGGYGEYIAGARLAHTTSRLHIYKSNSPISTFSPQWDTTDIIIAKPTTNAHCDIFGLSGSDTAYNGTALDASNCIHREFPFYHGTENCCTMTSALLASSTPAVVTDVRNLRRSLLTSDIWRTSVRPTASPGSPQTKISGYSTGLRGNVCLTSIETHTSNKYRYFVRGGRKIASLYEWSTSPNGGIYSNEGMVSWYTVLDGALPPPRVAYVRI
jgi:hypothetical protein